MATETILKAHYPGDAVGEKSKKFITVIPHGKTMDPYQTEDDDEQWQYIYLPWFFNLLLLRHHNRAYRDSSVVGVYSGYLQSSSSPVPFAETQRVLILSVIKPSKPNLSVGGRTDYAFDN